MSSTMPLPIPGPLQDLTLSFTFNHNTRDAGLLFQLIMKEDRPINLMQVWAQITTMNTDGSVTVTGLVSKVEPA